MKTHSKTRKGPVASLDVNAYVRRIEAVWKDRPKLLVILEEMSKLRRDDVVIIGRCLHCARRTRRDTIRQIEQAALNEVFRNLPV